MKYIDFDQSSSIVLAAPPLRLIFFISTPYYQTIGIIDVTNALQNTLKASSKREIIDCPPY